MVMMKTAWYNVLINGWLAMCTCEMNVAMLFLMLASDTMIVVELNKDASRTILSSCWQQIFLFLFLIDKLKENQSEKLSIILEPGESSGWRGEKEGKIPYTLLFESTKYLLILALWQLVRDLRETGWWHLGDLKGESMSKWIIWLGGRANVYNCDLPVSFWRWSFIRMRLAIALILSKEDILKVPSIQMVALLYILFRIFRGHERGA